MFLGKTAAVRSPLTYQGGEAGRPVISDEILSMCTIIFLMKSVATHAGFRRRQFRVAEAKDKDKTIRS